jgi:hypothetical protein
MLPAGADASSDAQQEAVFFLAAAMKAGSALWTLVAGCATTPATTTAPATATATEAATATDSWPNPAEGACVDLPGTRPDDFWARSITIAFPKTEEGHVAMPSGTLAVAAGTSCPAQRWTEVECQSLPAPAADALYRDLASAGLPALKRRTANGERFSWLGVTWISVHAAGGTCDIVVASGSEAQPEVARLAERIGSR